MALEGFFTLMEMKDGLLTLDRVEELVAVMQKEKDFAVKNVAEVATQWSVVANALVATENMAILKHFIELGGLYVLGQWLQEAQQYGEESPVEESTCELLRALEKLPIDNGTPIFSEIMVSVKNLIEHKSSRIQEKAKALLDWFSQGVKMCDQLVVIKNGGSDDEVKPSNAIETVANCSLEHSAVYRSAEVGADGGKNAAVLPRSEMRRTRSSACTLPDSIAAVEIKQNSLVKCSRVDRNNVFQTDTQGSPIMSDAFQPSICSVEESSKQHAGGAHSTATGSDPVTGETNGKTNVTDVVELKDNSNNVVGEKSTGEASDKMVEKEITNAPSFEPERVSSADTHVQQSVLDPAAMDEADDKESEFCVEKMLPSDVAVGSATSEVAGGFGVPKLSSSKVNLKTADENDVICSNVSQDVSVTESILKATEHVSTCFLGETNDVKELGGCEGSATTGDISEVKMNMKTSNVTVKSRMDSDVDFVEDDSIGIARQVGIEAEKQVVDYREPLCSSSSKQNSEGRVGQPGSPDSVNGEQDQPMLEQQDDIPDDKHNMVSAREEDGSTSAKNVDVPEDAMSKHGSQVTEAVEQAASGTNHGFDLNEMSWSHEMDQTSVVVSPAAAAAASSSKVAELKLFGFQTQQPLEEKLRLGMPTVTSSFCPPSLFRSPDAEKAFSVEGSSSSKQRTDFLDIDLNVAEEINDGAIDATAAKIPVSAGLPSGESSVEVSSKRAQMLQWDLNHTVGNLDRSPSPVSWPLLKQRVVRNLDLNDNLAPSGSHTHLSDRRVVFPEGGNSSGGPQVDGPCISLMGTKIPVPSNPREGNIPQTMTLLPNGPVLGSACSSNHAPSGGGAGSQYAMTFLPPSPGYGYNGRIPMEPFASSVPGMYGSSATPYFVDPREVSMQMMGSPMVAPAARLPFSMNSTNLPPSFNWLAVPQPNLNPRLSFSMPEVDNREHGGIPRQVLVPGQVQLHMMEQQQQQMASGSQSGMGVKRKEPDNGCDPQLGLYRRQPPWH